MAPLVSQQPGGTILLRRELRRAAKSEHRRWGHRASRLSGNPAFPACGAAEARRAAVVRGGRNLFPMPPLRGAGLLREPYCGMAERGEAGRARYQAEVEAPSSPHAGATRRRHEGRRWVSRDRPG